MTRSDDLPAKAMRSAVQYFPRISKHLALVVALFSTSSLAFGAEDFAKIAKEALSETHAKAFQSGDIKACVALYAGNAKFFVDNKLIASGRGELLQFYKSLREEDRITSIVVDEFVEIGGDENVGWVIFTYTKEYDLKNRDLQFIKNHKLEGFSALKVRQYGTALFSKIDGHWRIRTMSVFDPELWEPKK
jgi:hypothetical protein